MLLVKPAGLKSGELTIHKEKDQETKGLNYLSKIVLDAWINETATTGGRPYSQTPPLDGGRSSNGPMFTTTRIFHVCPHKKIGATTAP